MNKHFKIPSFLIAVSGVLCLSPLLSAQPIYLNGTRVGDPISFIGHYDGVQANMGTMMNNCYSCFICHNAFPENSTNLTAYATDWRAAWVALEPARTIDEAPNANAVQAWTNVEASDSDGDGTTNINEIKANSNPGDKNSTPTSPGACPNSGGSGGTGGTGGSGNTTLSSSSQPYNMNSLNAKCSFNMGAGMVAPKADPVQETETIALFFLPLLTLAALRLRRPMKA